MANTAVGAAALLLNTNGSDEHSVGTWRIGFLMTPAMPTPRRLSSAEDNTTLRTWPWVFRGQNTDASFNTAVGGFALRDNTTGASNTAVGAGALERSATAGKFSNRAANTGVGWYSLFSNTTGNFNTGVGGATLALATQETIIRRLALARCSATPPAP